MQEGEELKDIEMSPSKRKHYSQEDYINDEKINVIQYHIVLYPEQENEDDEPFEVYFINDQEYTIELFKEKIINEFISSFEEFQDLNELTIVKFYIKKFGKYFPYTITDINKIPETIYVEFSSEDAWIKTFIHIEMDYYSFQITTDIKIYRDSTYQEIYKELLKMMITFWNNVSIEKPEILEYTYIISGFDIFHSNDYKEIWNKNSKNYFNFELNVKGTFTPIEELVFTSLQEKYQKFQKDKWNNFKKLKSFIHFTYDPLFSNEFHKLKLLITNKIMKLNNQKKIYLYFSSDEIEERSNDSSSSSKSDQLSPNLQLVIIGKVSKQTRVLNNVKRNNLKYNTLNFGILSKDKKNVKIENPKISLTQLKQFEEGNTHIDQPNKAFEFLKINRRKFKNKKSFGEINMVSKILLKTYEEKKDTATDITDNELNINLIKKNALNNQRLLSIDDEFTKVITKSFLINLIEDNSTIELKNCELDNYSIPYLRNYTYKIFINSELRNIQEEYQKKNSKGFGIFKYIIIAFLIIIIIGFIGHFITKDKI